MPDSRRWPTAVLCDGRTWTMTPGGTFIRICGEHGTHVDIDLTCGDPLVLREHLRATVEGCDDAALASVGVLLDAVYDARDAGIPFQPNTPYERVWLSDRHAWTITRDYRWARFSNEIDIDLIERFFDSVGDVFAFIDSYKRYTADQDTDKVERLLSIRKGETPPAPVAPDEPPTARQFYASIDRLIADSGANPLLTENDT